MLERMLLPGAETCGPIAPVIGFGPRDEKLEIASTLSVLPTLNADGLSPGDPSRPQPVTGVPEPLLPAENVGKMPLARSAAITSSKISLPPGPPQLWFSTCGRRSGFGLFPARSVGAIMNCC